MCNARIQAVRRLEVGVGLAAVYAMGGGAAFGAVTVRHAEGDPLPVLLDGLTYGLARIARDRTAKRLREDMGYLGRVQALEVTHGGNGWHPHRHPLAVFRRPPQQEQLSALHLAEFRAFARGVQHRGLEAPSLLANVFMPVSPGSDTPLGEYLAKSVYSPEGAGFEMTSTQGKRGRRGSRTPWQILGSFVATGDADDLELWHEYESAMRGKRALTWSRGLRAQVGIGTEASDDEIAAAEVGDAADTGFTVDSWEPIYHRAELGAGLLAAVTPAGDWAAGREYARRHGIRIRENDG